MRHVVALLATLALILAVAPATVSAAPQQHDTWIVQLKAGVNPAAAAPGLAKQHGGSVGFKPPHRRNVSNQVLSHLLDHHREQLSGVDPARYQGGRSPQRGLLSREFAELSAGRGVGDRRRDQIGEVADASLGVGWHGVRPC